MDQLYRLSLVLSYGTRIGMENYQGVDRAGVWITLDYKIQQKVKVEYSLHYTYAQRL